MKSVVIEQPEQLALVQRPVLQPAAGEIRLAVKYASICGSDVHIWHGHNPFARYPRVIGHEFSLLAAAICVALAGNVQAVTSAVALMSVSIFFLYITGAIYWAIIQDVVHKSRVGSVSGFIHLIGSLSGIVGPIVTGFIVQHTGHINSAFVLAGVVAALGALLVWFVIKSPKSQDNVVSV